MEDKNIPKKEFLRYANIEAPPGIMHYDFLKFLENKPDLIYNILSYKKENKEENKEDNKEENKEVNKEDMERLFDFFFNLYYGSSITEKKTENYVLALIYCFLQDALNEINKKEDILQIFEKKFGYCLKYLFKQKHIKEYFLNILSYQFKTIEFNNNGKWLFEKMKKMDEKSKKEIQEDMEKYKDTMDENEKKIFNEEFNINQSKFSMEIKKFNEEKLEKKDFKNYSERIKYKLLKQLKNEGIDKFKIDELINILGGEYMEIEFYYHYAFSIYNAYRCVENILLTLGDSLNEIPNLVKYILKMLQESVKEKFPNDKEIIFKVIKKFFFELLLFKLNTFPYFELIYDENVISPETKEKTEIINKVIERFIEGKFYSNQDGNIIYAPLDLLFFQKKLKKLYLLFDDEFYENINYSKKIKEFIKNKKWENVIENNEETSFKELSFCTYSEIQNCLIDIINSLKKDKKFNIEKEKFFGAIKKKEKNKSLKENGFFICQKIEFPFEIKKRNIPCFSKQSEDDLINKIIIFLFGISNLNEKDYDFVKIKTYLDFMIETLELIKNGKIISLGIKLDVSIEWYANNIITILKRIDEIEKIFEIKNDLEDSIKEIDEKSSILYDIYSNINLLPEKQIENLKKISDREKGQVPCLYIPINDISISCYDINEKIIKYVYPEYSENTNNTEKSENKNNIIEDCMKLFEVKDSEINLNNKVTEDELDLEILNFPNILFHENKQKEKIKETERERNNREKQLQRHILQIKKYLTVDKYFDDENKKKVIKKTILDDENIIKKVFDYVLKISLKKGLNSIDYYSTEDSELRKNFRLIYLKPEEDEREDLHLNLSSNAKELSEENFFSNDLKDHVKDFKKGFKRCMTFFELEGEPNQKMKYLEEAYDIVKNVYELNASSATFDIQTIILLWKYFIMSSNCKKLFSSFLILHLFIRKDLLTITQVEILFAVKEVIGELFNLNIDQFINVEN